VNTYAKIQELEQRIAALEAKVMPVLVDPWSDAPAADSREADDRVEALEDVAEALSDASEAILEASKPRRKK
jgi:hypothetical protein